MSSRLVASLAVLALMTAGAIARPAAWPRVADPDVAPAACEDLTRLAAPNIAISSATTVAAGAFSPSAGGRGFSVPEFCRVVAVASPSPDSQIGIEVWIPT